MPAKTPKPNPRETKSGSRKQTAALLIRSKPEWKAAVEALAEEDRCTSVSEFIDRAVAFYARAQGMQPPPRR